MLEAILENKGQKLKIPIVFTIKVVVSISTGYHCATGTLNVLSHFLQMLGTVSMANK